MIYTKQMHSTSLHFLCQKESLIYKFLLMRKHFIQTSQKEYISRHAYVVCLVKPSRLTFRYWCIVYSSFDMTRHLNICTLQFVMYFLRQVTKGVVRSYKSKDRQHNDHEKKGQKNKKRSTKPTHKTKH
jgi:hypothetical protein